LVQPEPKFVFEITLEAILQESNSDVKVFLKRSFQLALLHTYRHRPRTSRSAEQFFPVKNDFSRRGTIFPGAEWFLQRAEGFFPVINDFSPGETIFPVSIKDHIRIRQGAANGAENFRA
jgi:hypothetical protein